MLDRIVGVELPDRYSEMGLALASALRSVKPQFLTVLIWGGARPYRRSRAPPPGRTTLRDDKRSAESTPWDCVIGSSSVARFTTSAEYELSLLTWHHGRLHVGVHAWVFTRVLSSHGTSFSYSALTRARTGCGAIWFRVRHR